MDFIIFEKEILIYTKASSKINNIAAEIIISWIFRFELISVRNAVIFASNSSSLTHPTWKYLKHNKNTIKHNKNSIKIQ